MASGYGAVWAIDIGNNSLKALHLSDVSGTAEVIGFDHIQHGKILTGSGVKDTERDELIALSLRQFVSKNELGNDEIVISVPSQNSFARFVNLPPVEPKRIPEIVRFEAAQQIPFDIDDVQWDWQLMTEPGAPESKVGIFAVKNEVVNSLLEHFGREDLAVSYVQMAPMALYNYVLYDRPDLGNSEGQAIVVLNIGAEYTDLVVCTGSTVWQRTIPMGGNAFTRAIVDTFKLNFQKAEKLKRTAAMSKYARQIFQTMRPVFTDLASEIQRSLGFYTSSNPKTKLSKIIALGGGTKMRGLLKYLQQSLQIPVERPDSFKRLAISQSVSAAKFHENVSDFGIVYGLALQGLGLARLKNNLLPRGIARSMAWASKAKYFTVAACLLLLVSVLSFARTFFDKANYAKKAEVRQQISSVIKAAEQASRKLAAEKSKASASEAIIKKVLEPFEHRDVLPVLHQTILSALPNEKNNPEQKQLYRAFAAGDVEGVLQIPRKEREQIFVTSMSVRFANNIETAQFGAMEFIEGSRRKGKGKGVNAEQLSEYLKMEGITTVPSRKTGRTADIYGTTKKEGVEKPGFVVTIVGYSPYKAIGELMDPAGVTDEPSKWGFITRLSHLDDTADGNAPFELYKKTKAEHFKLETAAVDLEERIPIGIGIESNRIVKAKDADGVQFQEAVLIDPMTKETISKITELDENGKIKTDRFGKGVYKFNDYWFKLNVKFVWKDALKETADNG